MVTTVISFPPPPCLTLYRDFSTGRVRRKLNLGEDLGLTSASLASSSSAQQVSGFAHFFYFLTVSWVCDVLLHLIFYACSASPACAYSLVIPVVSLRVCPSRVCLRKLVFCSSLCHRSREMLTCFGFGFRLSSHCRRECAYIHALCSLVMTNPTVVLSPFLETQLVSS